MKKLNENIRDFRMISKLTQQEVADRLYKSKNVVSNWERGDNSPNPEEINKLCEIFECTPNDLFGFEESIELQNYLNVRKFADLMQRAYHLIYRSLDSLDTVRDCKFELEQFKEEFESEYGYISISLNDIPKMYERGTCYLYYILNEEKDKVKIGISANPLNRAKTIQTSSGEEIELLHTIEFEDRNTALQAEAYLHSHFSFWRKKPSKVAKSCEWFDSCIVTVLREKYWAASQILEEIAIYEKVKIEEMNRVSFY